MLAPNITFSIQIEMVEIVNNSILAELSSHIFALVHKLSCLVCKVLLKARRKGLDQGSLLWLEIHPSKDVGEEHQHSQEVDTTIHQAAWKTLRRGSRCWTPCQDRLLEGVDSQRTLGDVVMAGGWLGRWYNSPRVSSFAWIKRALFQPLIGKSLQRI